jgi:hypothetical protein
MADTDTTMQPVVDLFELCKRRGVDPAAEPWTTLAWVRFARPIGSWCRIITTLALTCFCIRAGYMLGVVVQLPLLSDVMSYHKRGACSQHDVDWLLL